MNRSFLLACAVILFNHGLMAQDTFPPDYYGEDYNKKVAFRENNGQVIGTNGNQQSGVAFYSEGLWPQVYLKKGSAFSFQFSVGDTSAAVQDTIFKFDVTCIGELVHSQNPEGHTIRADYQNFYLPWTMPDGAENVQAFKSASYINVWDSVDMHFYSGSGGEKIAFVVKPGGNPDDIQLLVQGPDSMKLVNGALRLFIEGRWLELPEAVAYQYDGVNPITEVNWNATYDYVDGSDVVSFHFDTYDTDLPLDPHRAYTDLASGTIRWVVLEHLLRRERRREYLRQCVG